MALSVADQVLETFFSVAGEILGRALLWRPKIVYNQNPPDDPSVFQKIRAEFNAATSDFTAFFADPRIFRFRINPNKAVIRERKLMQAVKTLGGWEIAFGGEDMINLTFDADTGYLGWPDYMTHDYYGKTTFGRLLDATLDFNPAYHNFQMFYDFYKKAHTEAGIVSFVFWGRYYEGHLTDFTHTLDANDPNHIRFTFNFRAYPDKIITLWSTLPPAVRAGVNTTMMAFQLGNDIYRGLEKSPTGIR